MNESIKKSLQTKLKG